MVYTISEEIEFNKQLVRKSFLETIWVHRKRSKNEEIEFQQLENSLELRKYEEYKRERAKIAETNTYVKEQQKQIEIYNNALDKYW